MLPTTREKSTPHRTAIIYSPSLSPRESISPWDGSKYKPPKLHANSTILQTLRRITSSKRILGGMVILAILSVGYAGSSRYRITGLRKWEGIEEFDMAGWATREDLIIPPEQFKAFENDSPAQVVEEQEVGEEKGIVVEEELVLSDGPSTYDPMLAIKFDSPQPSLFSQLRENVSYITTMSWGGHANQFLAIINLLHLAHLTGRVAIIPTLSELHFDGDPEPLSSFYDIPKFYAETRIPYVEMTSIKMYGWDIPLEEPEEVIGCYSTLFSSTGGMNWNDGSMRAHLINVESFPIQGIRFAYQSYLDHDSLFEFDQKSEEEQRDDLRIAREDTTIAMVDGFSRHHSPAPDPQILCFDSTFFVGTADNLRKVWEENDDHAGVDVPYEMPRDYEADAWRLVGQYIRFTSEIEGLAESYLVDLFGVNGPESIPPFISMHIRRTDFAQARGLISLESYSIALDRLLARLQRRIDDPTSWRGPSSHLANYFNRLPAAEYEVVVTTDEKIESTFVRELKGRGWKVVDHRETEEKFGGWYAPIIDAAILARGSGFVGTEWSTFSFLAGLRVKYWNGGLEEYTADFGTA